MKLQQLRYFQMACRFNNISKAANELHISQPTISMAIRDLEDEFGIVLIEHQRNGFALTESGERFLKLSDGLLDHADEVSRIMTDMGLSRHQIGLGMPPMLGALLFPVIYSDFCTSHPDIELHSQEGSRAELLELLDHKLIDLAFVAHGPGESLSSSYGKVEIMNLETVCCVSKQNPLAAKSLITPEDLKDQPIVMFTNNSYQGNQIGKFFRDANIVPQIIHKSVQLSTIETLVSNNLAAGFMFRELGERLSDIQCISLDPVQENRISLVWNKDMYMYSDVEKFIEYFKNFEKIPD